MKVQARQSYPNPNDIFCRNKKIHPKVHTEYQETLNRQNNIEKEEQIWKCPAS